MRRTGHPFQPVAMAADMSRTQLLNQAGDTVLRDNNHDVMTAFDAVLTSISNWFASHEELQ